MILASLQQWTEWIGWTLVNSLWQALAIALLLLVVLRLVPSRWSRTRYATACAGLVMFVASAIATFVYLAGSATSAVAETPVSFTTFNDFVTQGSSALGSFSIRNLFWVVVRAIENYMPWIMIAWSVGALLSALRLVSGWLYLGKLKNEAIVIGQEWQERVSRLTNAMAIRKMVHIAESMSIQAPLVIGFVKPVILLPVGMIAGLSTEQVETVIVHELAHIKRHDFLINLIQAVIETIFFFNPFVWLMSNLIRREREYCCDDEVVQRASSLAYVHALAQLEEWRLSKPALAVALAENKNQLLNRIRRIMEKSGQNYSAKDRMIPAVLLVIGLICASWLTIKTDNKKRDINASEKSLTATTVAQDTTIKKKDKAASRTTIITFDDKGEAHEQIIEEYNGDYVPPTFDMALAPTVADWNLAVPSVAWAPAMTDMPAVFVPMVPSFDIAGFDTIPDGFYHNNDWKEFSEAFEKRFKEQFGDFYKKNQKDFDKMMKEMQDKFAADFESTHWKQLMESRIIGEDEFRALAESEDMRELSEEQMREMEHARQAVEDIASIHELVAPQAEFEQAMVAHAADVAALEQSVKLMEEQTKEMELRSRQYEKEVKEMLIKDGYLGKDEKLNSLEYNSDEMKVNGKKIKDSDREKYMKLKEKYFRNSFYFYKTE